MSFTVIVPARLASTRLPRKPLADIGGAPMVVRVAQRARASRASRVVVAADDAQIVSACQLHGIETVLTSLHHETGTDRLAEAAALLGLAADEVVVNVQGDEPRIAAALIRAVAEQLAGRTDAAIATACHPIHDAAEMFDPNAVKVVMDKDGYALYFSRAPIPFARDAFGSDRSRMPATLTAYRHLGLYAYRCGFLRTYSTLAPSIIEQMEALEQLRALWHGHRISVAITDQAPEPGVDTPADLESMRKAFAAAAR